MRRSQNRRWLAVVLAGLFLLLTACGDKQPAALAEQPLGQLPAWSFTSAQGQALGSKQLAGQPWAANFLFTSCPTSCPPLAKATAKLQGMMLKWRKPGGPKLVSFTVDPESDSSEALRIFGRKYGAKVSIWKFARAPYAIMEKLVVEGFYQPLLRRDRKPGTPVSAIADKPTPLDTAHGLRFVLVDGQGRMRALYEKNEAGLIRLDAALRWLSEHPGQ